jgi:hypothetical protein
MFRFRYLRTVCSPLCGEADAAEDDRALIKHLAAEFDAIRHLLFCQCLNMPWWLILKIQALTNPHDRIRMELDAKFPGDFIDQLPAR